MWREPHVHEADRVRYRADTGADDRADTHALADAAGLVARVGLHDTVRLERVRLQHYE